MTTENESPDLRRYREEWAAMTARVQALEGERDALLSLVLEVSKLNLDQFIVLREWNLRGAEVDGGA